MTIGEGHALNDLYETMILTMDKELSLLLFSYVPREIIVVNYSLLVGSKSF